MTSTDVLIPAAVFTAATAVVLATRGGRYAWWRYFIPHRHLLARRIDHYICLKCPRSWSRHSAPPRRLGRL